MSSRSSKRRAVRKSAAEAAGLELAGVHGMSIPRTPVFSSSIASIGYSAESILDVELVRGGVYRYFDVPRDVYDALTRAESIGAYFNRCVRSHYQYARVKEADFMQLQR
jgi:hypothetical protein